MNYCVKKNVGSMYLSILIVAILGLCQWADAEDTYLSPVALVADASGENLYVAEYTAKQIAVFDVASEKVVKTISIPGLPAGLALSSNGKSLYVTTDAPDGKVHVVDLGTGKVTKSISVGHTPIAPVLSPDGKTLYVSNRFNNDISVIDLGAAKEVTRIAVTREPVAAAITPDGKFLVVTNHLPAGAANTGYASALVSVIDTASRKVINDISLPNGSTGLRGICISPDGKHAYATHILARYQVPTTQLERGWMNTNALSVIDVKKKELINTVLLDDIDLGAANPWGVACTSDGASICVTHAGTHEVSVIDRAALHEKLDKAAAGDDEIETSYGLSTRIDVPNNLAFLVGLRKRVPLKGNGPRGLAIIGSVVYAAEYFTDSLGVTDINSPRWHQTRSLPLGPEKELTIVRKGEMFFHDGQLCFQKWQSCTTCHPDVRSDALNWDLLNDGMGNMKNSKSLVLSLQTPPAMITGIRADAETGVRAGIKFIQFVVRPEEDAVAIDEYLKSLRPVQSPYLKNGQMSEAAKRGENVYKKARCSQCHTGEYYTDMEFHDVGTGEASEVGKEFDTPTLCENWRTAPYLYDGRAATIKEVLTTYNKDDRHGITSVLSEEEIDCLAEYVLTR